MADCYFGMGQILPKNTMQKVHGNEVLEDELYLLVVKESLSQDNHPIYQYSIEKGSFIQWNINGLKNDHELMY